MSERMSEYMPDRMSEYMPDRMSEYMPKNTSRWYVRNYIGIVCRGGAHSEKVVFLVTGVAR